MPTLRDQHNTQFKDDVALHDAESPISNLSGFCGVCAGMPMPEIATFNWTREDARQFRIGYFATAIVCAILILMELAILAVHPAHARPICPAGYGQIEKVYVSSKTSDIVLPDNKPRRTAVTR